VTFSDTADGRITGHLAYRIQADCNQRSLTPHAGSSRTGFTTGVTSADYDNVKVFVKARSHFPIQKLENI
jgi:hypothetical protein